ncbi:zinc finger dihydrouridine synthase [Fistulina hepatica ATCC 64428]|uniref:tRNA-dihydrouridine(47) synthase [NAD(P)(+)] n=1 Tax=Fistulina hepatica ATCC 64428 TaxID=1128425 RepID=A0A0D7A3J6_9AGAR|nr:zinc finger dihydrouridine synthase [Fistulina hepatica ATCC 64428]
MSSMPPGTACVKPEYLLPVDVSAAPVPGEDSAEGSNRPISTSGDESQTLKQRAKDKQRGANKGRRFQKVRDEGDLCFKAACGSICDYGAECRYNHDIAAYLSIKPPDLRIPEASEVLGGTMDFETQKPVVCPVFAECGNCKYGFKCRFLSAHSAKDENGEIVLVQDKEKMARTALTAVEMNSVSLEVRTQLRKKKYPLPVTEEYLKTLIADDKKAKVQARGASKNLSEDIPPEEQVDTPDVPIRFAEKRRLNWRGKSYLAPLTTLGNLPFRRICVDYGADITCGEMGLATSFLTGSKEEFSLIRRHPSESLFGVQVAGNKPHTLVPTAELLAKECSDTIDFVDVNCGCPIDLVFKSGSGSALLDQPSKLSKILIGMNKALGSIPVTIKLRTGIKDGRNLAHKLMPRIVSTCDVGCMTLHGRTRQQRYTKLADWEYIKQCVEVVRAQEVEYDCMCFLLPPVPILGGGDCFSSQDYWTAIEATSVDGVMVARGALIKPWIFTEIKEHREWDISSRERLDSIRKVVEYLLFLLPKLKDTAVVGGVRHQVRAIVALLHCVLMMANDSHFGSDTPGINTTRRYLCEALSFQYRYIPIGLLERLPGRINDRAPAFRGRDDLETLLASPDSRDWVKISEFFLGPAPESWVFIPKHKSNASESQG